MTPPAGGWVGSGVSTTGNGVKVSVGSGGGTVGTRPEGAVGEGTSVVGVSVAIGVGVSTIAGVVAVGAGVAIGEFGSGVFVGGESKSPRANDCVGDPAIPRVARIVTTTKSASMAVSRVR